MQELIYCCRHCLHVETTGVIVGSATTIETIQHFPLVKQCTRCNGYNCVPISSTMISAAFKSPGGFSQPE